MIKILDYKSKEKKLEKSNNLFALVILSQLKAIASQSNDYALRKEIKFDLMKQLYSKNFDKKDINSLFTFIDGLIGLPSEMEEALTIEIQKLEETNKMPDVSNFEKFGIEKGRKEGIEKGEIEVAQTMLSQGMHHTFIAKITALPLTQMKDLKKKFNK